MSTFKTVAFAAALTGLAGLSSMAIAQTAGSQQHHSSQGQNAGQPQAQPQAQAQQEQRQGMTPGMMQGQNMEGMMGMMGMMHGMMHGQGMGATGQGMSGMGKGDQGPASLAFAGINARMHRDMDMTYTGKTDVDFAKAMIAHHQGAIDMAKVELAFGEEPEIKKLAEEVIKAQEGEIAFLKDWLRKNGQ